MLDLESQPLRPSWHRVIAITVEDQRAPGHHGRDEAEAIVVQRRPPLSACRVDGVEDAVRVLFGALVGWLDGLPRWDAASATQRDAES